MWLIADYHPVSLFSFRSGLATSSGAKTLLLPTPFGIRTALLDAAIRTGGVEVGRSAFNWIRQLSLAVRPPERIVVTNLFGKTLKPTRKEQAEQAMDRTIAFREYAYLAGGMALAFGPAEGQVAYLGELLPQINYFGKRGGFFQLIGPPHQVEELPSDFVSLDGVYLQGNAPRGSLSAAFVAGVVQVMDDWGDSLTLDKVNIYTDEDIVLGRDRVRKGVVLPYRVARSSRGFTLYERIGAS